MPKAIVQSRYCAARSIVLAGANPGSTLRCGGALSGILEPCSSRLLRAHDRAERSPAVANTGIDIRNPIFHDDDAAREYLETVLWPQGPVCPRCGVTGDRITKLLGKSTRPG